MNGVNQMYEKTCHSMSRLRLERENDFYKRSRRHSDINVFTIKHCLLFQSTYSVKYLQRSEVRQRRLSERFDWIEYIFMCACVRLNAQTTNNILYKILNGMVFLLLQTGHVTSTSSTHNNRCQSTENSQSSGFNLFLFTWTHLSMR